MSKKNAHIMIIYVWFICLNMFTTTVCIYVYIYIYLFIYNYVQRLFYILYIYIWRDRFRRFRSIDLGGCSQRNFICCVFCSDWNDWKFVSRFPLISS